MCDKHSLTGVTSIEVYVSDVIERRFEKVKTAIYFVKLVRKRIKQIFSGSLEKQSLTLMKSFSLLQSERFFSLCINWYEQKIKLHLYDPKSCSTDQLVLYF
jgi:hypothetical protein